MYRFGSQNGHWPQRRKHNAIVFPTSFRSRNYPVVQEAQDKNGGNDLAGCTGTADAIPEGMLSSHTSLMTICSSLLVLGGIVVAPQ
eukprot:scaffold637254_cov63-Attheya_sp.AAC.1